MGGSEVGGSDVGGADVDGLIAGGAIGTLGFGAIGPVMLPEAGVEDKLRPRWWRRSARLPTHSLVVGIVVPKLTQCISNTNRCAEKGEDMPCVQLFTQAAPAHNVCKLRCPNQGGLLVSTDVVTP